MILSLHPAQVHRMVVLRPHRIHINLSHGHHPSRTLARSLARWQNVCDRATRRASAKGHMPRNAHCRRALQSFSVGEKFWERGRLLLARCRGNGKAWTQGRGGRGRRGLAGSRRLGPGKVASRGFLLFIMMLATVHLTPSRATSCTVRHADKHTDAVGPSSDLDTAVCFSCHAHGAHDVHNRQLSATENGTRR
jgi:hypothetical protein